MEILPNYWTYKSPIEAKKDVLKFRPYSGPNQTRSLSGEDEYHEWEIGNDDSDHDNFLALKAFWRVHYPGVQFYLHDVQLDETRVYEIDSNLSEHYNHQDSYSWKMRISEAFPYTVISGAPPP